MIAAKHATILAGAIVFFLFGLHAATACMATAAAVSASGTDAAAVSTRVLWTVSGYVMGRDASWGESEAKALLFKPLDVTDDAITFDGQVCSPVHFEREWVAAGEYLWARWHVTPQELGVTGQIQLIKTDCDLPGFCEYLRLNDSRLIVPINGVFFIFDPALQR